MPFRDVVGGHPEGSGPEEAHRPAANPTSIGGPPGPGRAPPRETPVGRIRRLVGGQRFRLQAAGLAALAIILLLAFLLPARKVRIIADGDVTTVSGRTTSDVALVEQAGIELEPGDRVEATSKDALVVRRATEAVLTVDGQTFALRTQAETIGELLIEADVSLEPQDSILRNRVFVSPDAAVAPPASLAALLRGDGSLSTAAASDEPVALEVRRAVPFAVVENGHELQLRSSRETLATALRDVGVRLGPGDEVQPPLDTELTAGLQVHVEHATQLVVTLPEEKALLYTFADTVAAAIAESGIDLPQDYRLEPPAETPISAGLAVHVVGISHEQVLETIRIESYTVYEPDPSLPPGATLVAAGQDGILYRQYAVEYYDGELVSRELTAEWHDPNPIDTVVYYSTAQPPAPAAPPASPAGGWTELVCSYDWDCDWALAVINCESGGNPNAYNPSGPYVGLFQIWEGHGANLTDPAVNIAAAYSLYLSGGPGNWPNCP